MTIHPGLIEKAAEALVERAYGQNLPEAPIDLARAALEAVAADLWDQGQKSGLRYADRALAAAQIGRPELPGAPSTNPYRIEKP